MSEIKRNYWSRFCRKFSETNQYRPATVRIKQRRGSEVEMYSGAPLVGVAVGKKGRSIDSIDIFAGHSDPDRVTSPAISLRQPVSIRAERDEGGNDLKLHIESQDGTRATVVLSGDRSDLSIRNLVERVAYSMYERRGYQHGRDIEDWTEAERRIRQAEQCVLG